MLLALIALVASFVFGLAITKRLKLVAIECCAIAFMLGSIAYTWLAAAIAFFTGFNFIAVTLSVTLLICATFAAERRLLTIFLRKPLPKAQPTALAQSTLKAIKGAAPNAAEVFFLLACAALFVTLFWTHALEPKSDGIYSGGTTWADLALHATLINSFSHGANWPPSYPFYPSTPLRYPFLADLHAASLNILGSPLRNTLLLTGVIYSLIFVALLYALARRITGNASAAIIASLLVLLAGGLGFIHWLEDAQKNDAFKALAATDYAHDWRHNIHWVNIVSEMLLPQRANVWGLSTALTIFLLLAIAIQGQQHKEGKNKLLIAGLLTGTLPLVYSHAFIAVATITAFTTFLFPKLRWHHFWLPTIALAAPQILFIASQVGDSFMQLRIGWMTGDENWLLFWVKNTGIVGVAPLPSLLFLGKRGFLLKWYVGFIALFAIANMVAFSPNVHDNVKIFYYWFIASAIIVASALTSLWRRGVAFKLVTVTLFFISALSGALSIAREAQLSWLMFSNEEIALAEWVKANTPTNATFLTSDQHNHFIPTLTGRRILMGYRGWLWAHGLRYNELEKDVAAMFKGGEEALRLMQRYRVDYVVIGPSERRSFDANENWFEENFALVTNSTNYKIFKLA